MPFPVDVTIRLTGVPKVPSIKRAKMQQTLRDNQAGPIEAPSAECSGQRLAICF